MARKATKTTSKKPTSRRFTTGIASTAEPVNYSEPTAIATTYAKPQVFNLRLSDHQLVVLFLVGVAIAIPLWMMLFQLQALNLSLGVR